MGVENLPDSMELSDEELELLTLLLEQEGIEVPKRQTIFPRDTHADLPLSFAQERLWFLDQWEPGTATYNVPAAVRLTGRLNIAVLHQGLNEIIRRHEALRTTFPAVDGRPFQVIAPALVIFPDAARRYRRRSGPGHRGPATPHRRRAAAASGRVE